ncbi:hypothetical protein JOQ06_012947 [Pogonophryne albipinna]|uniref:Uncharacterized protein n=1 Tax=Pogonophryne albipinna TaxID=1090488 RepID=A0AAD6BLI7_9TELE|nr:hypothetical protein JOQ06_012947 [Pogonophryne albipinna]
MEDVLRQNTTELGDLRTKALDTKFNQESFENNEEKTTFYTGLPNFLVLLQVHITHNSLYKEVIFSPDNKVAVVDVELSLYLMVVGMSPVQLHSAPIVDETEALFSSTQAKIGLLLFAVWALKVQ